MLTFSSVAAAKQISVVLLLLTWSHLKLTGISLKSFRRANIHFQTNIDPSSTVELLTTRKPDSDTKDKQSNRNFIVVFSFIDPLLDIQHTTRDMIAMARYYEEAYKVKGVNNIRCHLHLLKAGCTDSKHENRECIFHCSDLQEQRVD